MAGKPSARSARKVLAEESFATDPLTQFQEWFAEAQAALEEPNAMTLATADADGRPSARMVLLKDVTAGGFTFYTNYDSRKGRELAVNPQAALVFYWQPLSRQVTATGAVRRVSAEESDHYFASRPRGSQLAARTSAQSSVLPDRETLEARYAETAARFSAGAVPRPPNWGGFVLAPDAVEFWQAQPDRLHDRLRYRHTEAGWVLERLSP